MVITSRNCPQKRWCSSRLLKPTCFLPILLKLQLLVGNPRCILTKVHPPPPPHPFPPPERPCVGDRTARNVSEDSGVSIFPLTSYAVGDRVPVCGKESLGILLFFSLGSSDLLADVALPGLIAVSLCGSSLGNWLVRQSSCGLLSSFTCAVLFPRDVGTSLNARSSGLLLFMLWVYYF